jgi:hypothetical protein
MATLPAAWASYGHLQNKLARRSSLNDYTWGLEGALDVILRPDFSAEITGDMTFRRASASAARKRRDHAARFLHTPESDFDPPDTTDLVAQLVAREALDAIANAADRLEDQQLLAAVGDGYGYGEATRVLGQQETSLRTRMYRLRVRFEYLNPGRQCD